MKRIFILALILIVLLVISCNAPPPVSPFEKLLGYIPDTPDTRSLIVLNDYVLLREVTNVTFPGPDASEEALSSYWKSLMDSTLKDSFPLFNEGPFISGYSRYTPYSFGMGQYLAFDLRNVDQSAEAGSASDRLSVMLGHFDPEATEAALELCGASVPDCEPPQNKSHEGIAFYSWGEDGETDLTRVLTPPAYDYVGRGGRIAVLDTRVFYTLDTSGMEALIEASLHQRTSLLDVDEFHLLANAMSELNAYSALISDQVFYGDDWREYFIDQLSPGRSEESLKKIITELGLDKPLPGLKPYLALAVGCGIDDNGPYMALALAHENAEIAEENVDLLPIRINGARSILYYKQLWNEWVDQIEVRADGSVLVAKLYGYIAGGWSEFMFNPDSLLMIESAEYNN